MKPRYIAWTGGPCPVKPSQMVEVVIDGNYLVTRRAGTLHWMYGDDLAPIIAYRVIGQE